jgi:hypothetical protein
MKERWWTLELTSEGCGTCSLASGGALIAMTVWFLNRATLLRS